MTPNLKSRVVRRDNLLPSLQSWVSHLRATGRRADAAVTTLARWMEVTDDSLHAWIRCERVPRRGSLSTLEKWLGDNPCPEPEADPAPCPEPETCLPGLSLRPADVLERNPFPIDALSESLTEAERLKSELVVLGSDLNLTPLQRMAFNGLHARTGRFVRRLQDIVSHA